MSKRHRNPAPGAHHRRPRGGRAPDPRRRAICSSSRRESSKISGLANQVDDAQTQVIVAEGAQAKPVPFRASDLFRLARAMPSGTDMPGILLALEPRGAPELRNRDLGAPVAGRQLSGLGYSAIPISITITGRYTAISRFEHLLRTTVRLWTINDLVVAGRLFDSDSISLGPLSGASTATGSGTTAATGKAAVTPPDELTAKHQPRCVHVRRPAAGIGHSGVGCVYLNLNQRERNLMAQSRRPTPAQIRERRARTAAIVLGVFMLIIGFIQGPKLLKMISGGSSGSTPAETSATATVSAAAVATITPSSAAGTGQLLGFALLKKQANPFHSQMPTAAQTSATTQTATTGSGSSNASGSGSAGTTTTAAGSTSTSTSTATTTTSTPTTTAGVTTTPAPVTLPITVTTPSGLLAAVIKVNGKVERIGVQGTFPKKTPLFELISFKGKRARIKVVGGSFADGQAFLLLTPGQKVTFVNQSDGTHMSVRFMKDGTCTAGRADLAAAGDNGSRVERPPARHARHARYDCRDRYDGYDRRVGLARSSDLAAGRGCRSRDKNVSPFRLGREWGRARARAHGGARAVGPDWLGPSATAVNHRNAYTSMESDKAFALAEEGIAYAEGRLYTATQPGLANNVPSTPITQDGGSIVYSGSLASTVWTLTATGTYNGVTRKVTVQAPQPAATVTYDTTPWNYFYVKGGPSCLPLGGNGSTNIPMYTQGDMCISGNGAFTGSDLEVKGNLTMLGGNATIGRSGHPISKMNVGGSCSPSSPGPPPTGCAGDTILFPVNAPGIGHTVPVINKPVVNFSYLLQLDQSGPGERARMQRVEHRSAGELLRQRHDAERQQRQHQPLSRLELRLQGNER